MFLWRAQSDNTCSAAKDVAVCSSCAKYSWSTSFADKICGAVLVAVPFFVFAVIICLLCAGLYDIITMIINLPVQIQKMVTHCIGLTTKTRTVILSVRRKWQELHLQLVMNWTSLQSLTCTVVSLPTLKFTDLILLLTSHTNWVAMYTTANIVH